MCQGLLILAYVKEVPVLLRMKTKESVVNYYFDHYHSPRKTIPADYPPERVKERWFIITDLLDSINHIN